MSIQQYKVDRSTLQGRLIFFKSISTIVIVYVHKCTNMCVYRNM